MKFKDAFGTDKRLERDGVWADLGGGARLLIARLSNPRFTARYAALCEPHRRAIQLGTFPKEQLDALGVKAMAECVLLDWQGIEDDEGGMSVAYTSEIAEKYLNEYPDLLRFVTEFSAEMSNFKQAADEDDLGN